MSDDTEEIRWDEELADDEWANPKEDAFTQRMRKTRFRHKIPLCSPDAETYIQWVVHARVSRPNPKIGFCEDCTLEYQAQMKLEGKCENPDIEFKEDKDGMIAGYLPPKTRRITNEPR